MKIFRKPIFAIILSSFYLLASCDNGQLFESNEFESMDKSQYDYMLLNIKTKIDLVLNETKPKNINLQEYKIKVLKGEMALTSEQKELINNYSKKLSDYGKFLANKNNIDINLDDKSETIALGGLFSPSDDLNTKYEGFFNNSQKSISGPSVWDCALVAVGADALWALGGSSASSWTAAAMTRAFSAVLKRFLGPIGVAIAVVTFGVCMAGGN